MALLRATLNRLDRLIWQYLMPDFLRTLAALTPLSPPALDRIAAMAPPRLVPRRTLLHRGGEVCSHFHFLESGLARVFYYRDGVEVTAWFSFPGHIVSAIDSFFTGQPSQYWIETLEDSTLCSVRNADIDRLYRDFPETERLGRLLITENYLRLDERMKLFAFHTAEERYHLLLGQFHDILQRVPLGMIASYLGITPETLSRIRSRRI